MTNNNSDPLLTFGELPAKFYELAERFRVKPQDLARLWCHELCWRDPARVTFTTAEPLDFLPPPDPWAGRQVNPG